MEVFQHHMGLSHQAGASINTAKDTVKWCIKGFGFIASESRRNNIFVFVSALDRSGIREPADGQAVTFNIEAGRDGRDLATKLKLALSARRRDAS